MKAVCDEKNDEAIAVVGVTILGMEGETPGIRVR